MIEAASCKAIGLPNPLVSVILPIYNAEEWLDSCLQSIVDQTYCGLMELCIYDDACTDSSMLKVKKYADQLMKRGIQLNISQCNEGDQRKPKGYSIEPVDRIGICPFDLDVAMASTTGHCSGGYSPLCWLVTLMYRRQHKGKGITVVSHSSIATSCGYAKNQAVKSSSGEYLCFLDADDEMMPERIEMQLNTAINLDKNTLVGSQVVRVPVDSTVRYTKWINNLAQHQLNLQIYTSNGPTIVMPTWFCHRSVFDLVGGFNEGGKGVPEDYIFFLKFLGHGGELHRVDKPLVIYRHHPNATTLSVSEHTIWNIRLKELEKNILSKWDSFTIWNAGKQGRKLYRDLSHTSRKKVTSFCDVDEKKINKQFYTYELDKACVKTKVPIVHFTTAQKPFVICVKLDLTGGGFENNLTSLKLTEGIDYVIFS